MLLKKILNHSFWLLIGNTIGRLAMFLTMIFAARLLPQEVFGQFSTVRNTVSMFSTIVSGSLGSTATKKVAESKNNREHLQLVLYTLFFINIIIASFVVLFIFFTSEWIVNRFFISSPEMVKAFYIGAFLFVATVFSALIQSILIGFENYKRMALIGIAVSSLSIPIIFTLLFLFSMNGVLWGVTIYFILDFLFKVRLLHTLLEHKKMFVTFADVKKESKNIISFSLPIFISIVITSISFWYARVILINSSNNFKEIAIFDASYQWLTIIMILTGATTSVALPMLSKAFATNDIKDKNRIFKVNLLVNLFLSMGMAIIFFLLAKQIMSVYGENYIIGTQTLQILSLVSILFTLSSLFNKYMISHEKVWVIVISSVVGIFSLFLVLLLNLDLKNNGLAWAFVAFYIATLSVYFFYFILLNKGSK